MKLLIFLLFASINCFGQMTNTLACVTSSTQTISATITYTFSVTAAVTTCTTPVINTAGASAIVVVSFGYESYCTISSTLSNTYNVIQSSSTTGDVFTRSWYATGLTTGNDSWSYTNSNGFSGVIVYIFYNSISSGSPIDAGATSFSNSSSNPGSVTPAATNEYMIACFGGTTSSPPPISLSFSPSGVTFTQDMLMNISSHSFNNGTFHSINTSASNVNAGAVSTPGYNTNNSQIITIKHP